MMVRSAFAFLLSLIATQVVAQAPAPPPPVPADVSPLYVVTYVELKPGSKADGASILKSWREAARKADGNMRVELVQSAIRPGQFVVLAAWRNKAAFDAHGEAAAAFREKLA